MHPLLVDLFSVTGRPAKRGHGTDKLPIVGVFLTDKRVKVSVEVFSRKLDIYRILKILEDRSKVGPTVYTDGFKMYRKLPKQGFKNEWVDHDEGELVRGTIHTNNIDGFWGILKRKLGCIGGMRRERL